MADLRVTCTDKQHHENPHEGITHLGGAGWKETRSTVFSNIENRVNTYYTYEGGKRADVKVVQGKNGKYVRTQADGVWTDNLLALNSCPVR